MRNFIVTIDGKSYSVGVEEVGVTEKSESRHVPVSAPTVPNAAPKISASGE